MVYFLSLGTNLGKKRKNLRNALELLEKEGVRILRASSLFKTQPVDFLDQPWFYNQVIEVESCLNPFELLKSIKKIEQHMGRKACMLKGPRVIDIDILLAGKSVINTPELVIPHPRLEERNFILIPFRELSPGTIHPVFNSTIDKLSKKSSDKSIVKKLD